MRFRAALLALSLIGGVARADEAFVPNQSGDDLTIVELGAMTPGATLPIGGKPAGIAVSQDGARAYVTSPEGHFVSVIDAKARRVLKRIAVVGQPFGVAVSPDGRRLYVADMNGRDLLEIDPDSEKTRRVEIGAMPSGVAVTPDGRLVIAAARDDNALVVIDALSFARLATIAVGRHPYGVTIDAGGRRAYTANDIFRDPTWRKRDADGALRVSVEDAQALGLSAGCRARITTAAGSAEATVEITETMLPGHASLPNGFGLDYVGEDGATVVPGVAPNALTSTEWRDKYAGTPWHKHVPARIEACRADAKVPI